MPGLGINSGTAFRRDILANRPVAEPSLEGFFFFATDDNGGTFYQCDGTTWLPVTNGLRTIVAGTGISIVNAPTTITVSTVLPVATSSTLGAIKVGAGLFIDANGILSSQTDKKWVIRSTSDPDYTIADSDDTLVSNNLYFMEYTGGAILHLPDVSTISNGLLVAVKAYGGGSVTIQAATGQYIDQGSGSSDSFTIGDSLHEQSVLLLSDNLSDNAPGWDIISVYTDVAVYGENIYKGGVPVGQRPTINLIEGTNITLGVVDDPTNNKVDVTINSGAGGGGDFKKLDEVEVGFGGITDIVFSGISGAYRNLMLTVMGRAAGGTVNEPVYIRFNGDTGNNYAYTGTGISGTVNMYAIQIGTLPGDSHSTTEFIGGASTMIINYANITKNKLVISTMGMFRNITTTGTSQACAAISGVWNNTSAINTITLSCIDSTGPTPVGFEEGTVATLYGLK